MLVVRMLEVVVVKSVILYMLKHDLFSRRKNNHMTFNSLMMHLFFILSNKILYVLLQLIFMIILFMHSFIEKCN